MKITKYNAPIGSRLLRCVSVRQSGGEFERSAEILIVERVTDWSPLGRAVELASDVDGQRWLDRKVLSQMKVVEILTNDLKTENEKAEEAQELRDSVQRLSRQLRDEQEHHQMRYDEASRLRVEAVHLKTEIEELKRHKKATKFAVDHYDALMRIARECVGGTLTSHGIASATALVNAIDNPPKPTRHLYWDKVGLDRLADEVVKRIGDMALIPGSYIAAIKELRVVANLGLAEAKGIIDGFKKES